MTRPAGLLENRLMPDRVNDLLLRWIMDSKLKPGDRLSEIALCEELGVSRTPIREALQRLVANELIEIIPHRGVFVKEIDHRRLEDMLDFRYLLEMHAAEQGIDRISPEELRRMCSLVEQCEPVVRNCGGDAFKEYVQRDRELHSVIVESGGNSVLTESYKRLAVFLGIARVRSFQSWQERAMTKGHEEHKCIVAAYEARDKDRVLQTLGHHLTRSKNDLLRAATGLEADGVRDIAA